ncbi:MAG: rRNA pseudouridine synthase [Clostridia bacterium]|nr:rRNA pseudouridine synthase [Clostridia bacterium]
MERIDKVISSQSNFSRKEVRKMILKKRVTVDGEIVDKYDTKIDQSRVVIAIDGKDIDLKKNIYLILNKPKGYISATEDKSQRTVLELVPEEFKERELFPAGRLDKDTTGLMLITNDGVMAHNILSPRKHIKKIYEVTIDVDMTEEMVKGFKSGIKLSDAECKSAELNITGKSLGIVTIREGRYHQIKRMFGCYGAKVLELNRIGMGNLNLPKELKLGECRELTENELERLQEKI